MQKKTCTNMQKFHNSRKPAVLHWILMTTKTRKKLNNF